MKNISFLAVSFIFIFALWAGPASAFHSGLAQVSGVTAKDLEVTTPTLLPTSPFYFLKGIGRNVQLFFTFNQVKKAELELKFADQKILETREVSEHSPKDTGALERAIANYQSTATNLKTRLEGLRETSQNPNVDKLLDKLADRTVKHSELFEELKEKAEDKSKPEFDKVKDALGEGFLRAAERIEEPDKLVRRLKHAVDAREVGDELEKVRKVEFFDHLEKKAEPKLKEELREARNDFIDDVKDILEEKFKEEKPEEIADKLKRIPGDEGERARIISEIKLRSSAPHQRAFEHVEEGLSEEAGRHEDQEHKAAEQLREASEKVSELERKIQEHPERANEAVKKHLAGASEKLAMAKEAFLAKKYGEAHGLARSAESLARNGLRLLFEEMEVEDDEDLREDMAELENKIERFANDLSRRGWTEASAPEAYRLLGEAKKHLGFARDAFAKNDFKGTKLHIGHVKDWLRDYAHLLAKEDESVRKMPPPAPLPTGRLFCDDVKRNISELDELSKSGKIAKADYERKLEYYKKELNTCVHRDKADKLKECGPRPGAPGNWVCKDGGWRLSTEPEPQPAVVCTMEYAPVCGTDGKTYSNSCKAKVAGVQIKYHGECGKPVPTEEERQRVLEKVNPTLPIPDAGETKPPAAPTTGTIQSSTGTVCSEIYDPVCGSDGKTYSNSCYAKNAGVVIKYHGKCEAAVTPPPAPIAPPPTTVAPPPTTIAPPPTTVMPALYEFKLEADDTGFYPSGTVRAPKGAKVKITFVVRKENVYYNGLVFRSPKFNTASVSPGGSASVEFLADSSFEFQSYWPLRDVLKATGKVVVE